MDKEPRRTWLAEKKAGTLKVSMAIWRVFSRCACGVNDVWLTTSGYSSGAARSSL
jgi:hypothetical protein